MAQAAPAATPTPATPAESAAEIGDTSTKPLYELLAQDWSKLPPDQGVDLLYAITGKLSNFAGVLTQIGKDVEAMKKIIQDWGERSVFQKAAGLFGGKSKELPAGVGGAELLKIAATPETMALSEKLYKNPLSYETRLNFVAAVGKSESSSWPFAAYYYLYVQICVAHCFGEFSSPGLQMALQAQNLYYSKLLASCKEDLNRLRPIFSNVKGPYASQIPALRKLEMHINRNIQIIQCYQNHANKAAEEKKYHINNSIFRLKELETLLSAEKSKEGSKEDKQSPQAQVFATANAVVHFMRYIPPLLPIAHHLAERMMQIAPESPIGPYLKARVFVGPFGLAVQRYESAPSPALIPPIHERFKEAFQYYSMAMEKIPPKTQKSADLAIIYDGASIFFNYYRIAKTTLCIELPQPWFRDNATKAKAWLNSVKVPERKFVELSHHLQQAIDDADPGNPATANRKKKPVSAEDFENEGQEDIV